MSRAQRICSIPGCGEPYCARGWCKNHYYRWKRNGDPMGGNARAGAPLKWLEDHVGWKEEPCLIFPYSKVERGYGAVLFRGRTVGAHRAMCILAHGEPEDKMVAAHSCGRGLDGCVNPTHLHWATTQQNAIELAHHRQIGIAPPLKSGVRAEDARVIASLRGKERLKTTADRYGISESMVCRIQRGNRRIPAVQGID